MKSMEKYTKVLLIAALTIFLWSLYPSKQFLKNYVGTVIWSAIIVAWISRVKYSIVQKSTRRYLMSGGIVLLFLFIFRTLRYHMADTYPLAGRYLWYGYYIAFIILPLIAFMMSLTVGKTDKEALGSNRILKTVMWICGAVFVTAALSNDLHGKLIMFRDPGNSTGEYSYGWMLYVVIGWMIVLAGCAFAVVMSRCRVSGCRRRWYIPVFVFSIGSIMFAVYYLKGGNSPTLFGNPVYLIHEVCVILFAGVCEACIDIGLIPSNSGYRRIFTESDWNVVIADRQGETVYTSGNMSGISPETITEGLHRPVSVSEGNFLRSVSINNGIAAWLTDVSGVLKINESIKEATRLLEDENAIISGESELRLKRASFEAQNRLYDSIIPLITPQLNKILELLDVPDEKSIFRSMLMCIYVKRRFNLAIVTDSAMTDINELYLAVRETTEALSDAGIPALTSINPGSECDFIDSEALLTAYDFFETIVENAACDIRGLFVYIGSVDLKPEIRIMLSTQSDVSLNAQYKEKCRKSGAVIFCGRDDDTAEFALSFARKGGDMT